MVRFNHPYMFYLLIPFLVLLIWNFFQGRKQQRQVSAVAVDAIRKYLLNRVLPGRIQLKNILTGLGIFLVIIASTGPQIGTRMAELKREGIDIFLALDTSVSMDAVDVKPSRLEKAKYELNRLINQLEGDRIGLIVFAGSAYLHCPLTMDYAAARLFLNSVDTDIVQNLGTDLASALELALDNIDEEDQKYKLVVLVTDGEDHQGRALEIAEAAVNRDILIHTLGVGTVSGGPIPIIEDDGSQSFKKDRSGSVVTTALNSQILSEIASITGGEFIRIENQPNAIGPLLENIRNMEKRELKAHVFTQYENRFQIFLMLGLICFIVELLIPTRSRKELQWEGRFTK